MGTRGPCTEADCTRTCYAKHLCRPHYQRARRAARRAAAEATLRLAPPEPLEAPVRTRIVGAIVLCPFCSGRHEVPIDAVDRAWVPAACRRGGLLPVTAIADPTAGRHAAPEPGQRTRRRRAS